MASLSSRNGKWIVKYDLPRKFSLSGQTKNNRNQKSKSFDSKSDAEVFILELELAQKQNKFIIEPSKITLNEFVPRFVSSYGKKHWSHAMYDTALGLLKNHILPYLGEVALISLNKHTFIGYFEMLKEKKSIRFTNTPEDEIPLLSSSTCRRIYDLLKVMLDQAVDWELIEKNPLPSDKPANNKANHQIWTPKQMKQALESMKSDSELHLAVHLAFICSMRNGEVSGLTWDCVDFTEGTITINKTLQRISETSLKDLPRDEIKLVFPKQVRTGKSVLVLKSTKTEGSNRKIYMTEALKQELFYRKQRIQLQKGLHGDQYQDFNLVLSLESGFPVEPKLTEKRFLKWQALNDLSLPRIVFHELRHSGATFTYVANGGNSDAVKGRTGHTTEDMVTHYTHLEQTDFHKRVAESLECFYTQ